MPRVLTCWWFISYREISMSDRYGSYVSRFWVSCNHVIHPSEPPLSASGNWGYVGITLGWCDLIYKYNWIPDLWSNLTCLSDSLMVLMLAWMTSSTLLHQHCLLTVGLRPLVHSRPRGKDGGQVGKSSPNLVVAAPRQLEVRHQDHWATSPSHHVRRTWFKSCPDFTQLHARHGQYLVSLCPPSCSNHWTHIHPSCPSELGIQWSLEFLAFILLHVPRSMDAEDDEVRDWWHSRARVNVWNWLAALVIMICENWCDIYLREQQVWDEDVTGTHWHP